MSKKQEVKGVVENPDIRYINTQQTNILLSMLKQINHIPINEKDLKQKNEV